jgi:hypothetical protein
MTTKEFKRAEESLTLHDVVSENCDVVRSEDYSSSPEDILHSGALPGSARKRQSYLDTTKNARLSAYMSIGSVTVAQTKGWRIRAAYRLVCYMSRIIGDMQGVATLESILRDTTYRLDPSITPFETSLPNPIYGTSYIRKLVDSIPFTYLPPKDNESLDVWCEAYEELSSFLRIDQGTKDEPASGIYGTVGLFRPNSARFLWPTRDDLLLYEQELMLLVFDLLCSGSAQRAEERVSELFGYSRPEAVMLVKAALRYGTAVYKDDFDLGKIRELKSLEIIADTAGLGEDPRAQLAARKQMHLVQGLTRNDLTEDMDNFKELAEKALSYKGEEEDTYLLE